MSPANRIRLLGTVVQGISSGAVVRPQVDSADALCESAGCWQVCCFLEHACSAESYGKKRDCGDGVMLRQACGRLAPT